MLGRLNPDYFLGGEIGLDVEGARAAIEERCAKPLGLSVVEAANGIVEIANAAMVNALHLISVQRGYDPRDFVLFGFGGAGPVHANALARDAEIPTLLIPRSPGIFSATGLLATDLKRDAAVTVMRRLAELDPAEIEATFAGLEPPAPRSSRARASARDAIEFRPPARPALRRPELRADDPGRRRPASSASTPSTTARTASPRPTEPVECVSLRLTSVGRIAKPPLRHARRRRRARAEGAPPRLLRREPATTSTARSTTATRCRPARGFAGPAVIEEFDSTTVVHPGFTVRVDDVGNLIIERRERERRDATASSSRRT